MLRSVLSPIGAWAIMLLAGFAGDGTAADLEVTDQRGVSQQRDFFRQKRAHVIVVGVDQCLDKQVQPRKHAEHDAKALFDIFHDPERLDASADNVQLLLGEPKQIVGAKKATRDNVIAALKTAMEAMGDGDLLIFAFFGQGASVGTTGTQLCYLMADSTLVDRATNALTDRDIARELRKVEKAHICTFLDVSFNGFDNEGLAIPTPANEAYWYEPFLGKKTATQFLPGRVLFLASNGDSTGYDLKQHGVFAESLIAGLEGEADKFGSQSDGLITTSELQIFLSEKISRLMKAEGVMGRQKHYALFGALADFPLIINPGAAQEAETRLKKFEKLATDKRLDESIIAEGRRLIGRMRKSEVDRILRVQYNRLADGFLTWTEFSQNRKNLLERYRISDANAARFTDQVFEVISVLESGYVRKINEYELVNGAIEALYHTLDDPLPEDIENKLRNRKALRTSQLKELLTDVRSRLGVREELVKERDLNIAWNGMLATLDNLTTYYSPERMALQSQFLKGNFVGIGVNFQIDPKTQNVLVSTPIRNSPAFRAGIGAGDIITAITKEVAKDGTPLNQLETVQTKGLSQEEVVDWIRGKEGTAIILTVLPAGRAPAKEFRVVRSQIEQETVFGVTRNGDNSWDFLFNRTKGIGYVRITMLSENTVDDLRKALDGLNNKNVKGLIVDLRFNLGGTVAASRGVSELFVGKQVIYKERDRERSETSIRGSTDSMVDVPIACLVNRETAAGSEIIASSLQDNSRGIIIGERTSGSASIQTLKEFHGGTLKYTIATFARPNGKNLDRLNAGNNPNEWGVTPDTGYTLSLSPKDRENLLKHLQEGEVIPRRDGKLGPKRSNFKDEQLEMAVDYLKKQIR